MKNIILIDKRINKIALFEMNLKIYLGATVDVHNDIRNAPLQNADLLIAHQSENELPSGIDCPIILLTNSPPTSNDIFSLPEDCELRDLLKTSASILGITAKNMAATKVPDFFPIPTRLIKFLLYAPFDLYCQKDQKYSIVLAQNNKISKNDFAGNSLYIKSVNRVRFVDSFSEQLIEMEEKLKNRGLNIAEKITCLDQTMELVGSKLQYSGIDNEVVALAKESVNSLVDIASKYQDTEKLIANIFNEETSFRYKNAQLMVFVTFHVLKTLDWWIDNQRHALSNAIYFHDILLDNDLMAIIRSEEEITQLNETEQKLVREHPAQTSQMIKNFPDISKETYTIILEHHADPQGQSFRDDPSKLAPLSKVFFICELYCNMVLQQYGRPFDEDNLLKGLHTKYKDEDSQNIISALMLLKLDEIIKAVTSDIDNDISTVREQFEQADLLTQAITVLDPNTQDDLSILKFAADNAGGFPDLQQKKIIKATTQIIDELEKSLVKGQQIPEEEFEQTIKGITEQIKDAVVVVKGCIKNSNEDNTPLSDVRDHSGRTKLMVAALSGNLTLLNTILAEKSDVKLTDATRKSALHYACFNGSLEIIERLIELGINLNGLDAKRRTPLFYAINNGHYHASQLLLEKGAWPHVIADLGITLPILAAHKGELELLKLLHQHKAPMHSRDHRNKNALDHAQMKDDNQDMIDFLNEITVSNS